MTSSIGWNHPIDESDQWDGFNDSGIEHFAGRPVPYLAREVNQNSYDSRTEGQVIVRFNRNTVETSTIPHLSELINTITLCQKAAVIESEKAKVFFQRAQELLEQKSISVLSISDHNTRGIAGPCKNGTPFFAFMKAHGQSKKNNSTELGSFGIGKFAPYAVSDLRTVFVSTVYSDPEKGPTRLTQGKSIFMSHDDQGSVRRRGVGFWGVKEKCQPVPDEGFLLPNWLQRGGSDLSQADIGTTLSILGFDPSPGWQERIAASVAENFFGSIANGSLRVEIDNQKYVLAQETIRQFFSTEKVLNVIRSEEREPELFSNAQQYWTTLSSLSETIVEESQTQNLGLCRLRIRLGEGLPKRVCFLRNGMFISDQIALPGLKNFSDFKDFVAVFECIDPSGIELLRAMEPPRHDSFQYARLASKEDQKRGKNALREVAQWIRDMLKRHAKDPVAEVTSLDELKDYFADDAGLSDRSLGNEESNPNGKIVIRARPLTVKPSPLILVGRESTTDLGNVEGVRDVADGGIDSENDASSPKEQEQGRQRASVSLNGLRAVTTSSKSRRISFTPAQTGSISVSVFEAGADSDYPLMLTDCSIGEIKAGRLQIDIQRGERLSIDVSFKSAFDGALKVVAHEV